ncbi:MAG TPA: ADYC domain-containing protein [Kofleriaceae bacterium]
MTRACITWFAALCVSACSSTERSSSDEQDLWELQGTQLQGVQMLGTQAQGMTLVGFQFAGATLNGAALSNVHIEKGELVATQNQVELRGLALKDAHLIAQLHNVHVNPPTTLSVEYWISDIVAESASYDPTNTGHTFLYTLKQNVDNTGDWELACPVDLDSDHVAIPTTAIWDEHGNRIESNTLFTFGCTSGAVGKCYRWGYRPWLTGYGDVVSAHWACTRLARSDFCGNGTSTTHEGTEINMWDNLPSPGPIQARGTTPPGMLFEAGWNTSGAVCLSHQRWLVDGTLVALQCPLRLLPPLLGVLNPTVCDTVSQVLGLNADALIFNESYILDLY